GGAEQCVHAFAHAGTCESPALGKHTGPDGLLAFATGYVAAFTGRHCTSDYTVDIDGDDARARCYLIAVNNAPSPPIISTTAVYEDVLRRTPDGWRFVHRRVRPDTAI